MGLFYSCEYGVTIIEGNRKSGEEEAVYYAVLLFCHRVARKSRKNRCMHTRLLEGAHVHEYFVTATF